MAVTIESFARKFHLITDMGEEVSIHVEDGCDAMRDDDILDVSSSMSVEDVEHAGVKVCDCFTNEALRRRSEKAVTA